MAENEQEKLNIVLLNRKVNYLIIWEICKYSRKKQIINLNTQDEVRIAKFEERFKLLERAGISNNKRNRTLSGTVVTMNSEKIKRVSEETRISEGIFTGELRLHVPSIDDAEWDKLFDIKDYTYADKQQTDIIDHRDQYYTHKSKLISTLRKKINEEKEYSDALYFEFLKICSYLKYGQAKSSDNVSVWIDGVVEAIKRSEGDFNNLEIAASSDLMNLLAVLQEKSDQISVILRYREFKKK